MKLVKAMSVLLFFAGSTRAFADTLIEAVPTGWRLQNYIGGTVTVYYTGTSCVSGSIQLPASATADEKNRFYSLVLAAKVAGKTVGIFYETTSGNCQITSFYAA